MTDQAPSIAAAIRVVFPSSRHRLCTWHLGENSKTNIGKFRAMKGFTDLFDFLTKYCETAAEFEHYWPRMMDKCDCHDNAWLNHLYSIKERWCPAYSKEYFSAGLLSSQRSETTNRSVSHRLRKTDGMCDFYKTFLDVVAEWRSRENKQDFRFLRDQFAKAISCCQERKSENDETITYLVWRPNKDIIRHEVILNKFTRSTYIVKRWTKTAMCSHVVDEETIDENVVASSVRRAQMTRKFVQLVTSCQDYVEARAKIEYTFDILREKVESVRGPILFDDGEEEVEEVSKEAYNKSKGWKKKVDKYKDEVKATTTEKFFQVLDDDGDPMIYSHPTEPGSNLNVLPKQKNFQPSTKGVDGPPRTEKSNKSNYTAQSSCVPPKNSSNPSSSNDLKLKKRKHPEVNSNRSFQYEKSKWYQYFDAGRNARNEGSSNASTSSNVSHYDEMLSMFDKTS
ncbi:protein FAR1-RELATED SEQUENCE 5-like [Chenopodium quinoa]|uniref:protein FAR1-RELATED SEQUENCE 5-like n=1 Tax=Chenopodium quinoa TaxID=63459 RepID=UPI000B76D626|nr:protein FAR1-RELATED SEQUENCE 5-like [Chenopodium quinoa]